MTAPAPLPIDHAARARIARDGLRETLFVEAGAGTGKTSTLVARIVALVTEEQVPLRDIAAITFTEAAAAELRDRVRRAFEAGAADASRPVVAERCRDALADLDGAAISTLHAFAQRLLAAHPLEVGIPPRVEVLDEVASTLAFEARWKDAVARWHADPAFEAMILRLESCGVPVSAARRASLKDVAAVFDANWDRLEDLPGGTPAAPAPVDRGALHAAIEAVLALGDDCTDPEDRLLRHRRELAPELARLRAIDAADDDRLLRLLRGRGSWRPGNRGRAPVWGDVAAARAAFVALDEAADGVLRQAVDQALGQWVGVLRDGTIAAAHARRDAGTLEFHDLLVLARRLLRTAPTARAALHRRYARLLLDEFQDTDPIQIELAVLLAVGESVAGAPDAPAPWWEQRPPDGRVFVVGDPKQSIYRFRRADIALYQRARAAFGDRAHVALTQNFRTVAPVLDWVNAVFGHLMPEEGPGRPAYAPLHAFRAPGTAPAEHRVRCFGPCHADAPAAAELRAREAADVAAHLAAIRAEPTAYPVADERTGAWRPARAADITVLIPSRSSLPMLTTALDARDIPYRIDTSTLVFDAPEIRDLLVVLRAVDDPGDALAVVAALRTPVLACPDPDLFAWVQHGGTWDHRVGAPPGAPATVAASMGALAAWHEAARWCEPATLLERIVRERDVFALALANRRPRDAWRRVRFLLDQARRFADVGAGHLRDFLDWAELQRREAARVPEPLLPETDDDAVRIMTFHGAKGLEFPIVVLSGLTTRVQGPRTGPTVHWEEDGRPAIRLSGKAATANFEVRNDFETEMDADEKLRLLYVGATRARDHLFVSTHRTPSHEERRATHAARLHDAIVASGAPCAPVPLDASPADAPPAPAPSAVAAPTAAPDPVPVRAALDDVPAPLGDAPADPLAPWADARAARLAGATPRRVWSATALGAALHGRRASAARAVDADADVGVAGEAGAAEASDAAGVGPDTARGGSAFGRVVHAVLQHAAPDADDAACAVAARVAALAEGLVDADGRVGDDVVADVVSCVRGVLASPTVTAALRAPRHWRELALAAPLDDPRPGAGAAPVLEGYVDLLAELDGELVLVDHKTDRVDDAALDDAVARHTPQLAAYAAAIAVATGRRVARAVLVFAQVRGVDGRRRAVERTVPDLDAAVAAVRAHVALAAASPAR